MQNVLAATYRQATGKMAARVLRREGKIPAVCYGGGRETFSVSLDPVALRKLLATSSKGRNAVISLNAGDDTHKVMVHEIQRDPVKRVPVHVDFRLVTDDDYVTVPVPLTRSGRSRAERNGGRLIVVCRSVDVRCQVRDIPDAVDVDVTELGLGDRTRASDLVAPHGCEIVYKNDYVAVATARPRDAEEGEDEEGEAQAPA